uniref:Uncharacterized protein n=1 Tax=Musca domestica TaxID=7370 RepID=A0A1I8N068_MUSDO
MMKCLLPLTVIILLVRVDDLVADVAELNSRYQQPAVVIDIPDFTATTSEHNGYDYSPPSLRLELPIRRPNSNKLSSNSYSYAPPEADTTTLYIPPASTDQTATVDEVKPMPVPMFLINTQKPLTAAQQHHQFKQEQESQHQTQQQQPLLTSSSFNDNAFLNSIPQGPIKYNANYESPLMPFMPMRLHTNIFLNNIFIPPATASVYDRTGHLESDGYHY